MGPVVGDRGVRQHRLVGEDRAAAAAATTASTAALGSARPTGRSVAAVSRVIARDGRVRGGEWLVDVEPDASAASTVAAARPAAANPTGDAAAAAGAPGTAVAGCVRADRRSRQGQPVAGLVDPAAIAAGASE